MMYLRAVLSAMLAAGSASAQPCFPYWSAVPGSSRGFGAVGFDDGTGSALYITGYSGGANAAVARWRNDAWEVLEDGLPTNNRDTLRVHVLDDGAGPQLYAYGTHRIFNPNPQMVGWLHRWTGVDWIPAPAGMINATTAPRLSWDDGTGPAIYGFTTIPPGAWAPARWNGSGWDVLGGWMNSTTFTMNVIDDGTGERLYLAGNFTQVGGIPTGNVARWNGTAWEGVGNLTGVNPARAIVGFEHDGRKWVYVTEVYQIGGQLMGRVMRWDGNTWSPLPGGGIHNVGINAVHRMAVYDDGRGPALYIAGFFTVAGGIPVHNIVRFNGTDYEPLGAGIGVWTNHMTVYDDGRGEALYIIGSFTNAGGGRSPGIAKWVGCPNCYANCDHSTTEPVLNVDDFTCFIDRFARNDPYANCTLDGVMNIRDFACFIERFAAGCP